MFETYRMLGRERQADLEREAQRAALARVPASSTSPPQTKRRETLMKGFILQLRHSRWPATLAAVAALTGGAVALAAHVTEVDPATVPTGFLAAHNSIADVPVGPFKRAVKRNGADLSVQHVRLGANAPTGWHTHPGPAFVTVVKGALTYEDACGRATYGPGQGFVDRGFGHVHRAIAGPKGVDFYVTYVLPPGSATHVIAANEPADCRARDEGEAVENDRDVAAGPAQPVVLAFEKRAVSANSYVGSLDGGGTIDVLVLDRSYTATAQHFLALFRVDRGDKWFAAVLSGTYEFATDQTHLRGKVTYGNWLQGAKVGEEGQLAGTNPLRFTGTLTLRPRGAAVDDS
jgi:quercetin dioxygenase-like cupin family protein